MKLVILVVSIFTVSAAAFFLYGLTAACIFHGHFYKRHKKLFEISPDRYRKELIETVEKIMKKSLLKYFVVIGIKCILRLS